MAIQNWIAVRHDIFGDPAVVRIAMKLKLRPEEVIGYLLKAWIWFDQQSSDGSVHGVSLDAVESLLAMPNFLHLMCEVGWLEYENETVSVPNWDRWLSNGAKSRLKKQQENAVAYAKKKSVKIKGKLSAKKHLTSSSSSSSSSSCSSGSSTDSSSPARAEKQLAKIDDWIFPDGWESDELRSTLDDWYAGRKSKTSSKAKISKMFPRFDSNDHLLYAATLCGSMGYQGLKPDYRPSGGKSGAKRPMTFDHVRVQDIEDNGKWFLEMTNNEGKNDDQRRIS